MKIQLIAGLSIAMGITLGACKVGQKYSRPALDLPETIDGVTRDSASIEELEWWSLYRDTVLQGLIRQTLLHNKDLQMAAARVRESAYARRITRAALYPGVSLEMNAEREYDDSPETTFEGKAASVSWEVDLWGKLRWANQESLSEYLETVEAQRALQVSLVAQVAQAYFELRALDMELGMKQYADAAELLARRSGKEKKPRQDGPEPIDHAAFSGYVSKGDAFADAKLSAPACPICGAALEFSKWVNQGDHRYMCLAECPQDGKLLLRIKFKHTEDGYSAGRLADRADEDMQSFYAAKSAQPRSRGRNRRRRKKISQ